MMSELLATHVEAALDENILLLASLMDGTATAHHADLVCKNYRLAAIGKLFLTGRRQPFQRRLHQSAGAWAHYLSTAPSTTKRNSRSAPFLDALATGAMPLAHTIAERSSRTWAQGEEYEEDFLFHEFLMQLACFNAPTARCNALLDRYALCLNDTEDVRLDVCRSLLHAEAKKFDAALRRLLVERETRLDRIARNRSIPTLELSTVWHLSVEGLALVQVARRHNLAVADDLLHVPALVYDTTGTDWDRDDWKNPDPTSD